MARASGMRSTKTATTQKTDDLAMKVKADRQLNRANRQQSGIGKNGRTSGNFSDPAASGYTGQGPGALGTQSMSPGLSNYGAPSGISQDTSWAGSSLNQFGGQTAADDPTAFWQQYGKNVQGWDPYGSTQGFFESTFNPMGLATMAYPGSNMGQSFSNNIAGMTGVANAIAGTGHFMNIDPKTLVGNVMSALASGDMKNLTNLAPDLANILSSGQTNPMATAAALITFLRDSLGGAIPQGALDNMTTMLQNAAREFYQQVGSAGNKNMDSTNFVKFAMSRLGPTLGF